MRRIVGDLELNLGVDAIATEQIYKNRWVADAALLHEST
jgi:hypothetical protein